MAIVISDPDDFYLDRLSDKQRKYLQAIWNFVVEDINQYQLPATPKDWNIDGVHIPIDEFKSVLDNDAYREKDKRWLGELKRIYMKYVK